MRFHFEIALVLIGSTAFAQQSNLALEQAAASVPQTVSTDGQSSAESQKPTQSGGGTGLPDAPVKAADGTANPRSKQQPKRILGLMPNYRAVSAGAIPPPPTPKQAFKIATQNSFDYSSFVFVGITSLLAEGTNAHPQLGKGPAGFWGYSWRGFVDKTDGNYWVIFALPTVFHEDERYYAKGEGSILKRGVYAASRVLITPNYQGHDTFNASEILGRGISQGISLSYYPSADQNIGDLSEKYGYAIGRDAFTNVFREFWPDIASHFRHRQR